jgi:hypothetical protein
MEASARTGVSPLRFSKRNMFHFLCGAMAAQRLAVAQEHERTYPLARMSSRTTARHQSSSAVPSKCNIMDLEFEIFDSDRLLTEVENMPALYD